MKPFITITITLLLLSFTASSSEATTTSIRGNIEKKDFTKLRASDRLVDDFQPQLQNLCTSGKTFKLGDEDDDDCVVSFDLKDLEPTSGKHVFKSHACGNDEDTIIIVTMDLEDKMPSRAARLNKRSMEWTELVAMPHDYYLEEEQEQDHGCMYTTVSNVDVDPKKVEKGRFEGDERRAPGGRRNLNSTATSDDGVAEPTGHLRRELQACSEYKVIRMAVRYDSLFCNDHGNGTPESAVAVATTIIEIMNPFFNVAPLCMKVELCSIEGSCSPDNDPIGSMISESTSVCDLSDSNNLLDNFRALFDPRPPPGCDATHLFGGGDPFPNDTIGCAEVGALCDEFSVAVNFMPLRYLFIDYVWLVSHELGHNLSAEHVLGEDEYIMSYGDRPDRFKLENINRMVNYVNQVRAQDSTCTATETVGPPTQAPTSTPCTGSEFSLVLQTDDYGEETSWDVTGANGNNVAQGNDYLSNSRYEINECLPSGTDYTFTIRDSYGDGICCSEGAGNYEISMDGTLVYSSNGLFGRKEVVPLSGGSCDGGHEFRLELQTDEYGDEVSWEVKDPNGNVVVQGGNYPSGENFIETTECLTSDGVHIFKIMDSYGDGMYGDAHYKLWYDGRVVIYHDGRYGYGESITVPGGDVL